MPWITRQVGFSASHYYWNPRFSQDENRRIFRACANRHGHGHNYRVAVTLEGPIQPDTGMIINFFDLDPLLQRAIVEPLDHRNLNAEAPFFADRIPTLENIAGFVRQRLEPEIALTGLRLHAIRVVENDDLWVDLMGERVDMTILTRRYTFSAAHKLWSEAFSEVENQRHFGKCVNLHGHNYTLDVSIAGTPAPETGMITDLAGLDAVVQVQILEHVDHTWLDADVPFLTGMLSTVENLAQVFYERLSSEMPPGAVLERVRLYESEQNWTEVTSTPA